MTRSLIFLLALSLSGCIPAQSFNFPPREEVAALKDPTESQFFKATKAEALKASRQALLNNGMTIEREEADFISAVEGVWSRNYSWNYAVGLFVFEEKDGSRINIVINTAPDIFIPLTFGLLYAGQFAEAKQIRIQILNAVRALLAESRG
jgi:hypothetical protein